MNLRETILSEKNIYNAIYALNSYISERNLLSKEDLILYEKLTDKFDFEGTIYHDPTKCNNIPVTHPINNRHERRKLKAMKRKKK